jgi:hypothetical protein
MRRDSQREDSSLRSSKNERRKTGLGDQGPHWRFCSPIRDTETRRYLRNAAVPRGFEGPPPVGRRRRTGWLVRQDSKLCIPNDRQSNGTGSGVEGFSGNLMKRTSNSPFDWLFRSGLAVDNCDTAFFDRCIAIPMTGTERYWPHI